MGDYGALASFHVLIGFEMYFLGFIQKSGAGVSGEPKVLLIFAFFVYLFAALLMVYDYSADMIMGNQKAVIFATFILTALAAILILIAQVFWYSRSSRLNAYIVAIDCVALIMSFLGSIFLIVIIFQNNSSGSTTAPVSDNPIAPASAAVKPDGNSTSKTDPRATASGNTDATATVNDNTDTTATVSGETEPSASITMI